MSKTVKLKLASLALAGLSAVTSGSLWADHANMTVDTTGGLGVINLDNPNYWFKLGGRLHLDQAFFGGGESTRSPFPSGSEIRRARFALQGGVGSNWLYKLEVDLVDSATRTVGSTTPSGNPGHAQFGEAFIAYQGCHNWLFALGNITVPYSLEAFQSSNSTAFMEMALPVTAFVRDTQGLGFFAQWHSDMFTLAGAIYHPEPGTAQIGDFIAAPVAGGAGTNTQGANGSNPGSDPLAFGGRLTFSPVHTSDTTYHLGLHARHQGLHDRANTLQFSTPTEIRSRQSASLTTNLPIRTAKDYRIIGFEMATQWNSVMFSGEYIHANVKREGSYGLVSNGANVLVADPLRNPGGDQNFDGYYFAASWMLTGETKEYDFVSGTFGSVHPNSSKGAWEIGARHSYIKLVDNQAMASQLLVMGQDPDDLVGAENSTTVGITWWVNDNVRFLLNYVYAALPNDTDLNIFGFRGQVTW